MTVIPKVSVIVPVYNVEKYLSRCLDTLINQTLKDIEIICVNDGSKDNSLSILKKYAQKDSRIKIIDKQNEGLSIARNDGLKYACGEYIGYVDSDDWVDLNFYEKLYTAAKKYNSDIACCNIIRCGKKIKKYRIKYLKEDFFTDNIAKLKAVKIPKYNYVWNKIYHRENLIKTQIIFPKGKTYEDIAWSIQIIYSLNGIVTVPDTGYYYRKNPCSIVMTKSVKHAQDCKDTEIIMINFAKENHLEELLLGYKLTKRDRYRFMNINLLKVFYYYPNIKKYYLFGIIPILKVKSGCKKHLA